MSDELKPYDENVAQARRLAILSELPAPVLDMARRRVFRLPAPGSLAS